MAMDLSFVLHEMHTRAISAVGFNAARRELIIGYEGMSTVKLLLKLLLNAGSQINAGKTRRMLYIVLLVANF